MKLYGSLTSPFVRAVRIAALELGLGDEVVLVPTMVKPTEPNREFGNAINPLRRVPAFETRDGATLIDSRVIIEYLTSLADNEILPVNAPARVEALNRHAAMAGATEALVSAMYETKLRPEELRWESWALDQTDKASQAFNWAEAHIDRFAARFDIGTIALVCLAGYARFRFPDRDWFRDMPNLGALVDDLDNRRSVADTMPHE